MQQADQSRAEARWSATHPPMTTSPSGRWGLRTIFAEIAAGSIPNPSTVTVIIRARNPTVGAKNNRFNERMALVPELTDVEAQQHAIHDRDAEDRSES
jgi:hypothetical protein